MKTLILIHTNILAALMLAALLSPAQTIYPDGFDEAESDALLYIENDGQLLSDIQWQADVIQYYMWGAPGGMFFTTSNFFVSATKPGDAMDEPDAVHRLDFAFSNGANNVNPRLLTPTGIDLRYYQHNGTFANVASGKRIVYENLYEDIHVHFYSNEYGPKTAIVFENGADPGDFELTVSGHDDIEEVIDYLVIHQQGYSYIIPEGIAYEVDEGGDVTVLNWRPEYTHDGNGHLTFSNLGSWNPNNTLIFQFGYTGPTRDADPEYVDWCTLFGGGNSRTKVFDLETDASGYLYAGGYTSSPNFPASNTAYQDTLGGDRDFFFARFTPGRVLDWATFIGGSKADDAGNEPFHFAMKSNNSLLVAASAKSIDFPLVDPGNGAYFNDTNDCADPSTGCWDGVIMEITSSGSLVYSTFFGDYGNDERLWSATVDGSNNFYVVGRGNYPYQTLSGAYNSTASGERGQVTKFDSSRDLIWSTAFGGGETHIFDCAIDQNGKLLVTGYTNKYSGFPIQNLSGAYNAASSEGGAYEGFVAQFNTSLDREWCTYLGGNLEDKLWSIDVSPGNEVVVSGLTFSKDDLPLTGGAFLQDTIGGDASYEDNSDGLFARFDTGRDLAQCSYFGGWGDDELRDVAFYDSHLFGAGATGSMAEWGMPFPGFTPPGLFVNDEHADGVDVWPDGYVMALSGADDDLMWTSFVGTEGASFNASEEGLSAVHISNDKVYVSGFMSGQTGLPYHTPGSGAWFQSTTGASPHPEGAICVFDISLSPLPAEEITENTNTIAIYPNPFNRQIAINHAPEQPLQVSVYDMQGRPVLAPAIYGKPLDLGYLEGGTYLLRVESGTNVFTTLIVKQ